MQDRPSATNVLLTKLRSVADVSHEDEALLHEIRIVERRASAGRDICSEGQSPQFSVSIISGLACSYKNLSDGRIQIVAFHYPGDIPDLQSLHLEVSDTSVMALTDCLLGQIGHSDLKAQCAKSFSLTSVLWRTTLIQAATFRAWEANLGQRPALARTAHLFCETAVQIASIGLMSEMTFSFPVTQNRLADALGTSTVHINRVLQELRQAGMLEFDGRNLKILDWDKLSNLANFDPNYLHLKDPGTVPFLSR